LFGVSVMSQIFISYRRTDAGGHAARIFDRLRDQFGAQRVFFDQDAIVPGDHFPRRIETAIRSAEVVLVVIGLDWLESLNARAIDERLDFVQREVSIAVERKGDPEDQVEVIPLLVGGAAMPERDHLHHNLRDSICPLFDYQALTFQGSQHDQDNQFDRLYARIVEVAETVSGIVKGRSDEPPLLSIGATAIKSRVPGMARGLTLPSIDVDKFERSFRAVSRMLLDWPQEMDGHWIERAELARLVELTSRSSPSVTLLLGGPGEGKSAILARVGTLLARDGTVLLAIKADLLPRAVTSLRQLDDWVGCGDVELATALRRIAEERRVVVLIDQLDSLGELMDQHSGRLSALLRLVESVRDAPNLHVIVSCREFEFRHDVRLKALRAEEVNLARIPWDRMLPALSARKIDTNRWSDEVCDVLSTPGNLAIYLQLLAQDVPVPDFTSYQALLDRVIKERVERVYGDPNVHAAERIAAEMATEEELSLGRARFSDLSAELDNLESAGIILSSADGLSVSFRHQTLFDVLRARSYLRDGSSLADYVVHQKQQSLFVRPTLWSALNYLRASDPPTYRNEFRRLWRDTTLRLHLRYLLIAFLGQVAEPTDEEAGLLFSRLRAPDTRPRVLWAMTGNATGWYSRLSERLPQLMTEPPRQAWATAQFLAGAINQHRDTVLALLQQHWMANATYTEHALHVLYELRSWNSESMRVAFGCVDRIVDQTPSDTFRLWRLMEAIAHSCPKLSLKLLAYYLNARTERIADHLPDGGNACDSSLQRTAKYEQLFHDEIWYDVGELFGSHPKEFIERAWPWFSDVFCRIGGERTPSRNAYRGHHGLSFSGAADESDFCQKAFEQMIQRFAEKNADAFVGFVIDNEDCDLNVVHRLLSLGLQRIAANRPQVVLRYLTGDSRRLGIAEVWYNYDSIRSAALIAAVVPALGAEDARRLEHTIVSWRYYLDGPKDSDVEYRSRLHRQSREHRLPLLRAFPLARLSSAGKRYLAEERRAFPDAEYRDPSPPRMRLVESPMSAEQMTKAGNRDIIRLFDTLPDTTEWSHQTRRWPDAVGGSIEASRAFADFAKTAPDRALKIVDHFEPGKTERPAGDALAALGASEVPAGRLIDCVRRLDRRGFASEPFRTESARCLREVARRAHGLDEGICELLEGWIVNGSSGTDEDVADSNDTILTAGESILWSGQSMVVLPHGNYPVLDALMLGRLLREPPDPSGCLAVLERHLERDDDAKIWGALAVHLPYLVRANNQRGIEFLRDMFARHPTVLNMKSGVMLIAHVIERIPDRMISSIVSGWVAGDWAHGPQAAGEIAALRLCRQPDSKEARAQVDQLLTCECLDSNTVEGLRVGLTRTFSRAWREAKLRPMATALLVRIVSMARGAVGAAVRSVFLRSSPLPVDVHTRELLEAVRKRPSVLVGSSVHFLVESLRGLLYETGYPVLVYEVVSALIEQADQSSGGSAVLRNLSDLADLALTLHRIPDSKEHGLELFERLLERDAPGLSESLRQIDRPAFR
jgi:hypothetical protein